MGDATFNVFRLAGDLLHVMSIMFLWQKIHKTRSCSGLSLKSQVLFMTVYATRYLDLFNLRLDVLHLYNFVMKCLYLGTQAAVLFYMTGRYRASYNPKVDTVRLELLVVPCVLLSYFFVPAGRSRGMFVYLREYAWTFSVLLEAVAIVPQMFLLSLTGESETITTHYMVCMGLYRGFYLLNWVWRTLHGHAPMMFVVLAGTVQTVLYSDFLYIYYKRVISSGQLKLPI